MGSWPMLWNGGSKSCMLTVSTLSSSLLMLVFVRQVRCGFSISWNLMLDVQTDVISYVDKKKAKGIAVNAANPVVKGAVSDFVFLFFLHKEPNEQV